MIEIVDDRFVLEPDTPRVGGTARVHKARDHRDGQFVALKMYDGEGLDIELQRESFLRERQALSELDHPHIVKLIAAGFDTGRNKHYVALEWFDENLLEHIERRRAHGDKTHPAANWNRFCHVVVSPLLDALAVAHSQRILHRDIKPQNVLLAPDGTPKLADFGLAKLLDSLRYGISVREFWSRPYTAPEQRHGDPDVRSDLYALGVTVLRCLYPREKYELTDDNVHERLEALPVKDDAKEFLRNLLAPDPVDRYRTALLAKAALVRHLESRPAEARTKRPRLQLRTTRKLFDQARELSGAARENELRQLIGQDLQIGSADPDVALERRYKEGQPQDWFELIGADHIYYAGHANDGSGALVLTGVISVPDDVRERKRERGLLLEHELVFGDQAWAGLRVTTDRLMQSLADHEADQREARAVRAEQDLFNKWYDILEAKGELERRLEDELRYNSAERQGDGFVVFRVSRELNEEDLDQIRYVPIPDRPRVVGVVTDVEDRELTLDVQQGDPAEIPGTGRLLVDRSLSRRALEVQKQALATLRSRTSARRDLADLVLGRVDWPKVVPVALGSTEQDLDAPKKAAVASALGSPDFIVVQGPPGTGKTTFIAELVVQEKKRFPPGRLLLSSQTHVAVDNAAVRISQLRPELRVVRVGRAERVDTEAQHLTVEAQLARWRDAVQQRSKAYLESWAKTRGIDGKAVQAYRDLTDLEQANSRFELLQRRIDELQKDETRLLERLTSPNTETQADTESSGLIVDEEEEYGLVVDELEERRREQVELRRLGQEMTKRLRAALGVETIASVGEGRQVIGRRFPVKQTDIAMFERQVALQEEWLLRFGQGRDFERALIDHADVVAGTCVGLASSFASDAEFDIAIIDEASKATPTETLIPMTRSKKWVLVGDEQQLPPFVEMALGDEGILESFELTVADLGRTVFGHLASTLPPDRTVALTSQHRMLEPIGTLVSECFYDGNLTSKRGSSFGFPSLDEALEEPVLWISTSEARDHEERRVGTSFCNNAEVHAVDRLLRELQNSAERTQDRLRVGVIAGYQAQTDRLYRTIRPLDPRWSQLSIDVHPVDSFQGQERDVIVYSVVRSNPDGQLGFLKSDRRLNVALSRGREGLVIVGDAEFCARAPGKNPLRRVLEHVQRYEGCRIIESTNGRS